MTSPAPYQAAVTMGVSPYPFTVMVAMGVVTGIMTQIAGALMMIVMTPGGYKFKDYARVGFPLLVLIFLASMTLVPIIWLL